MFAQLAAADDTTLADATKGQPITEQDGLPPSLSTTPVMIWLDFMLAPARATTRVSSACSLTDVHQSIALT